MCDIYGGALERRTLLVASIFKDCKRTLSTGKESYSNWAIVGAHGLICGGSGGD